MSLLQSRDPNICILGSRVPYVHIMGKEDPDICILQSRDPNVYLGRGNPVVCLLGRGDPHGGLSPCMGTFRPTCLGCQEQHPEGPSQSAAPGAHAGGWRSCWVGTTAAPQDQGLCSRRPWLGAQPGTWALPTPAHHVFALLEEGPRLCGWAEGASGAARGPLLPGRAWSPGSPRTYTQPGHGVRLLLRGGSQVQVWGTIA